MGKRKVKEIVLMMITALIGAPKNIINRLGNVWLRILEIKVEGKKRIIVDTKLNKKEGNC